MHPKAQSARWSVIALTLALSAGGCVSEEARIRQEVMRRVAIMDTPHSKMALQIADLGPAAIPYVDEALWDPYLGPAVKADLVNVLHMIRDRRSIPALAKVADSRPIDEVTDPMVRLPMISPAGLSLNAQRAIVMILGVKEQENFGTFDVPFPDLDPAESAARRREYCTNLNKWYKQWRTTYDPSQYSAPAAKK